MAISMVLAWVAIVIWHHFRVVFFFFLNRLRAIVSQHCGLNPPGKQKQKKKNKKKKIQVHQDRQFNLPLIGHRGNPSSETLV